MEIPNPFLSFRLDTLQVYLLPEYLQFALRFEKRLMVLHHWQHFIRIDIFSDETCFSKIVLIYIQSITFLTFLHMVYQSNSSSVLHIFSFFFIRLFHLSKSSLFNFNFVNISQLHHYLSTWFPFFWALNLLTAAILFPSFYLFLVVNWVLYILVTVYNAKLIPWKTLVMFMAWDTETKRP